MLLLHRNRTETYFCSTGVRSDRSPTTSSQERKRERLLESIEQTENNLDEMRKDDKNGGLKMSLPGTEEATPLILHRTRNLGFKN